jgi:hypothetical protein
LAIHQKNQIIALRIKAIFMRICPAGAIIHKKNEKFRSCKTVPGDMWNSFFLAANFFLTVPQFLIRLFLRSISSGIQLFFFMNFVFWHLRHVNALIITMTSKTQSKKSRDEKEKKRDDHYH